MREFSDDNEAPSEREAVGEPKFGRLLLVLGLAVLIVVVVTLVSEAWVS
jgi:hypothetical protein